MANLTTKELSCIEDTLNQEQTLIKKFRSYSQSTQDQALKSQFEQLASRHQKHFDCLLGHLN
ncbi:MAG: spore coat protein [Oscillospiraceae bacterium]|nr:spore coat protein [Oscillospiraceae bacterium]